MRGMRLRLFVFAYFGRKRVTHFHVQPYTDAFLRRKARTLVFFCVSFRISCVFAEIFFVGIAEVRGGAETAELRYLGTGKIGGGEEALSFGESVIKEIFVKAFADLFFKNSAEIFFIDKISACDQGESKRL